MINRLCKIIFPIYLILLSSEIFAVNVNDIELNLNISDNIDFYTDSDPLISNINENHFIAKEDILKSDDYNYFPAPFNFTLSTQDPLCFNSSDGMAWIASITGGSPPFTYEWLDSGANPIPGENNDTIAGLSAGNYFCRITDNDGTKRTKLFKLIDPPIIFYNELTVDDITCNGYNDGSIMIDALGGTGTLEYSIDNGLSFQLGDIFTDLGPGNYNVVVKDENNCTISYDFNPVTVSEPGPLVITLDGFNNLSCYESGDGAINVSVTGGSLPYTYSWTGPGSFSSSDEDIINLDAGDYNLNVTDDNLCAESLGPVTLTQPDILLITIDNIQHVSCNGADDGAISVSVTGGTLPYSYAWTGPGTFTSTNEDISNLEPGDYDLDVTDGNGCTVASGIITITEPAVLTITLDLVTHISCFGADDGSITVTVAGGTLPYTYTWSGPGTYTSSNEDISNLGPGDYSLLVTDDNGCTANLGPLTINESTAINIVTDLITNVSCFGGNDGAISITVTGGTLPYTFDWTDLGSFSSSSEDLVNLFAGNYSLTVTDNNGCTKDHGPVTVTQPPLLTFSVDNIQHVSCNGADDGAISVTVAGGTLPYSYAWTGPGTFTSTNEDISNLEPGDYDLDVTDANGCTVSSGTITITEPAVLTAALDLVTHVSCFGADDGAISVTVTGGILPYTYSWDGPGTYTSSDEDISDLGPGDYSLLVTDDNGCTVNLGPVTVNEPVSITIVTDLITNVSCFGESDGAISITVTGGTLPYSFYWTGPGLFSSSDEDLINLSAGEYNLTLTDANGCIATHGPDTVKQPGWLTINIDSIIHVTCNGADDGSIWITPSGGTPPYSYLWVGPDLYTSTDEDISDLAPGNYTLTLTDANGCNLDLGPLLITEPDILSITVDVSTDISCYGANDGSITVTTTGGNPSYSYAWTGPGSYTSTSEDISGLGPGDYNLTVTDANSCTDILGPVTISEPTEIIIITDLVTDVSCNGGNDGVIAVTVNGGVTPYIFDWKGPGSYTSTDEDISGLTAGDYTLVVTDATGCKANHGPETVTEPPLLTVVLDSSFNITCNGDSDGAIYITVSGGTLPYTFSWTGPVPYSSPAEDITNLGPGDYNLEVTDGNGCKYNLGPVTITEPAVLTITVDSLSDISCFGALDGAVYVTVTGGTSPYDFSWSGPGGFTSTDEDITGLEKGNYDLVVTGSNGCVATIPTQSINEPLSISVAVDPTSKLSLSCYGDTDGKIDITVSGGTPPFMFSWTGLGGYTSYSEDISGLIAGEYNLTITDANGCSADFIPLDTITQPSQLQLSLSKNDISCFNDNNGTITAIVTGGIHPYEYSKNNFTTTNPDSIFKNLPPALYTIYVRDANSCKVSDTITIKQPPELRIISGTWDDSNNKCFGDSNATISITAVGGTNPLEYSIDSGYTYYASNFFSGLPAGNYYVFVRDQNGCLDEGSKLVVGHPAEIMIKSYAQLDITSCSYSEEGQIAIEASGGVSPIKYTLDGSENNFTGVFNNISAGPHLIEITDANLCLKDTSVFINSPPPILVDTIVLIHIIGCYGDSTGSIDVAASGGTGLLEYSSNGGPYQPAGSFPDLPGGSYIITIRDGNNCTLDTNLIITQPDTITTSSIVAIPVTCNGDTDGSITVTGSGGTPPYTYTLNPGSISNGTGIFDNLPPGVYTVTINDANGCPAYTTPDILIDEATLLLIDSVSQIEITCYGMNDGQINIYASGGFTPLSYSVNNGTNWDTASIFKGLPPLTYYIVVLDSGGCMVQGDTLILSDPPQISLDSESVTDINTCYGDSTGSLSVSASGGRGTLLYSIDSISWQVSGDFSNLPGGNYTVFVSDTAGCSAKSNLLAIMQPEKITAVITMVQSINGEPGSIHISASGGTGNLDYSISGPSGPYQSDTAFLNLWPGDYPVVVRDENGCIYEETVTLEAVPLLEIDVSYSVIDCNGENTGTITLISINGTGSVNYSIDGGTTFFTEGSFSDLPASIYPLYITDEDHRIFKDTVNITEPPELTVIPTITNATCSRYTYDGSIILSVTGGTPDYTFLWSNDSTTKDLLNLEEGSYPITITDANNCTFQDTFIVAANISITANAGNDTSVCPGEQVILNGEGGINYFWQPETGLSNPIIANPVATITKDITYTLTVTEPGGCYDRDSVTIGVHPLLGIDAGNDTTVAAGQTIQLNAFGGTFETYSWTPQEGLDNPASPTPLLLVSENMVYRVTGISIFGCSESDSLTITTAGNLIIYNGFTPNSDGINDFWDIDNVEYYPNITVEVYNRWGAKVFSSRGYTSEKRWDGTYKGKDVAIGTYYYVIHLNDGSKPISGHVTIVR